MNSYENAIGILKKYKQEHVINEIDKSFGKKKEDLIKEVLSIDFAELSQLYKKTFEPLYMDLEEIEPITGVNPKKISEEVLNVYKNIGTDIVKKSKFATVTMAGGQGTRLRTQYAKRYF